MKNLLLLAPFILAAVAAAGPEDVFPVRLVLSDTYGITEDETRKGRLEVLATGMYHEGNVKIVDLKAFFHFDHFAVPFSEEARGPLRPLVLEAIRYELAKRVLDRYLRMTSGALLGSMPFLFTDLPTDTLTHMDLRRFERPHEPVRISSAKVFLGPETVDRIQLFDSENRCIEGFRSRMNGLSLWKLAPGDITDFILSLPRGQADAFFTRFGSSISPLKVRLERAEFDRFIALLAQKYRERPLSHHSEIFPTAGDVKGLGCLYVILSASSGYLFYHLIGRLMGTP